MWSYHLTECRSLCLLEISTITLHPLRWTGTPNEAQEGSVNEGGHLAPPGRRSLEACCRFGSPGVLKSDRGRKEAIRDRVDPVCTLRGRRSDCRVLVNWCTLERCDP